MIDKKGKEASFTKPLLSDLMNRQKAESKLTFDRVSSDKQSIGSTPLEPPALYEDSGEGYNADFVFPQE